MTKMYISRKFRAKIALNYRGFRNVRMFFLMTSLTKLHETVVKCNTVCNVCHIGNVKRDFYSDVYTILNRI